MKNFFLLFGLVITLFANAQTEKKLRQHRLNVEASKLGHTSIVSMDTVCKLQLLKQAGLDTFKAETWVTLKGNVKKIIARNQDVANNFKMVERDRSAKFIVKGNDIYQDNIIIGSFDESTVKDPMGGFQNHIEVFNTQRQMVSFSTETAAMSHEWRTVTNKDSKYHLIKSGPLKDEDIFYMIIFLIDNLYL